jgi:hypothetical protein
MVIFHSYVSLPEGRFVEKNDNKRRQIQLSGTRLWYETPSASPFVFVFLGAIPAAKKGQNITTKDITTFLPNKKR